MLRASQWIARSFSSALFLCGATGCSVPYGIFSARLMEERAREMDASPALLEVVAPESLASVKRIAVVEFRDISYREGGTAPIFTGSPLEGRVLWNHDSAGLIVAEHFEEQLLRTRTVEVVERSRLALVLEEQALQQSGVTGEPLPEVLAGTAGADAVLLGTITTGAIYQPNDPNIPSAASFAVTIRLVDTRDGRILAFGRESLLRSAPLMPEIQEVLSTLAARLVERLADQIREARRAHPNARPPSREDYMLPRTTPSPSSGTPPRTQG